MTPTTFPCPFCGRKMGVGPELLGRQVRCPHCKQVIVAPPAAGEPRAAAAPPPPPPAVTAPPPPPDFPVFNLPSREGQESIFGETAEAGDEVFGGEPARLPVPELPPPVAPPPPPAPAAPVIVQHAPPVAPPPAPLPVPTPAAPANPWAGLAQTPTAPPPAVSQQPTPTPLPAAVVEDEPPPEPRRDRRRPERDGRDRPSRPERGRPAESAAGGGVATLFKIGFFLLAPYALLMTVLAVYGLFIRDTGKAPEGHPLSLIPDTRGEFPPAERRKTGKLGVPLDGPLPPELTAGLGQKVAVGAVEVEPTGVALRRLSVVKVLDSGKKATYALPGKAVVLTLSVRNTSPDLTFHPLDPAFNRKATDADPPPTQIVVGKNAYAGGAVRWPSEKFEKTVRRAYEAAQEGEDQPLGPGESRTYVITSDAKPDVVQAVQGARDTILWRVQVRRGLAEYRGREVPVTALIGVEFKASDVTED